MTEPETAGSSIWGRRWVRRTLLAGVWAVPAITFAVLSHARYLALGERTSIWIWLADHLVSWYTWAAFSPLIARLGRRFRLDRAPRQKPIAVHLAAAIAIALVHSAIASFTSIFVHGEPITMEHVSSVYVRWLAWSSPWSLVIYWVVLSVTYAVDYYGRARDERLRATQLESQVVRAQLDALQLQLQPHFLFNTLNSISVLMQKGDVAGSTAMLNGLSDLLRYVLRRDGQQVVPLSDELDFVRRYLEIEKMRFGERLRVSYDVDPASLAAPLPPFLLQLLVENAIRHGITKKAGEGNIAIRAAHENGRLRLTVEDDGVGIGTGDTGESEGIGIRNARQRLGHLYHGDYRLELTGRQPSGAMALLEIPVET